VDLLFMVSAGEAVEPVVDQHRTFLDAAASVGVGHEVYRSFTVRLQRRPSVTAAMAAGEMDGVHDTVERVTGRSAIALRTLLLRG